jgi:hypothetical protein
MKHRTAPRYPLFLLATLAVLLSACASIPDNTDPQDNSEPLLEAAEYQARIETLLETFDGIAMTAEGESELVQVYREIRPLLVEGRIRVQVDYREPESRFASGRFTVNSENGLAVLQIHHRLLDIADENPVPALTSYAGLIAYLQDYRIYGEEVIELYRDPLEYYLARMDAIYLQGLFVRDFALPIYGESSFSDFEYYVIQSLEVDGFSSHSLFVWSIDKDIVYSMLALSTQFSRDEVSAGDYIREVLLLGRDLRDAMETSRRLFEESGMDDGTEAQGNDRDIARRNMYIASASAKTYRTLGSLIFGAMVDSRLSEEDFATFEDSLAEIDELYSLLELLLEDLGDFPGEYRQEYLELY